MATQVLKDDCGRKIGQIAEMHGRLVLTDDCGRKKGEYDPTRNITTDDCGRKIGEGNLLTMLLHR